MRRDYFERFHPVMNFAYFGAVIILGVVLFHPVTLFISLASSLVWALILSGKKALKFFCGMPLVMMLLTVILNPLFVHQGVTVLFYLGETPITREATIYGLCAALMIGGVMMWFYDYSKVMTSDRFMAVTGRIAPASSLVFSMALRFVPRFAHQAKSMAEAQRLLSAETPSESASFEKQSDQSPENEENDESSGGEQSGKTHIAFRRFLGKRKNRVKSGLGIMSMMTTWALENSIDTSDSMRARGYGLSGRTTYSNYRYSRADALIAVVLILLLALAVWGKISGALSFSCYPYISFGDASFSAAIPIAGYFLLTILPTLLNTVEVLYWKLLRSKI